MADDMDNPIDEELMRELGLEPQEKPTPTPVPKATPAVKGGPPSSLDKQMKMPPVPPRRPPMSSEPAPMASKGANPSSENSPHFQESLKNLATDLPVQVVAVMGKKTMTLKEVMALKQGEVVELKKLPQESIDLVANGKLIARGELVLVDGKLGIQIKQLIS